MAIDCQMWNDTASSPDGVDFDKVAESVLIDKLKAYPNVQTLDFGHPNARVRARLRMTIGVCRGTAVGAMGLS